MPLNILMQFHFHVCSFLDCLFPGKQLCLSGCLMLVFHNYEGILWTKLSTLLYVVKLGG